MKLKYIFAAFAAVFTLGLMVSCSDEFEPTYLDDIKVSNSYITFAQQGGTQSISITTTAEWTINEAPEGFTVSPMSGSAGTSTVTFGTEATELSKTGTVVVNCNGKQQYLNLQQEGASYPDFKEGQYWIMFNLDGKWIVAKPCTAEIGNGSSYAYIFCDEATGSFEDGTLASTAANVYTFKKAGSGFHVSDSEGGYLWQSGTYNNFYRAAAGGDYIWSVKQVGAQAYQVESNTSHVLCYSPGYSNVAAYSSLGDNLRPYLVPAKDPAPEPVKVLEANVTVGKDGGQVTVPAVLKADNVSVDYDASWLHYYGTDAEGFNFKCDANDGGARTVTVTATGTVGSFTGTVTFEITQEGSIAEVSVAEFLAAEVGATQFRLTGRIKSIANTKYGNFYLQDASGEVYVYGLANGDAKQNVLTDLGINEGDLITIVGQRAEYKGTAQVGNAVFEATTPVKKISAVEFNALADDANTWYELTGVVTDRTDLSGHKFDLKTYGNFDLVDETGNVYVYGLSTGWNGESKKCETLGLAAGDKITIVAHKASYKDAPQAGNAWFVGKKEE